MSRLEKDVSEALLAIRGLEQAVTRVETLLVTTLPHLATKADLTEIRAEVVELKVDVAEGKTGVAEAKALVAEGKAQISEIKAELWGTDLRRQDGTWGADFRS